MPLPASLLKRGGDKVRAPICWWGLILPAAWRGATRHGGGSRPARRPALRAFARCAAAVAAGAQLGRSDAPRRPPCARRTSAKAATRPRPRCWTRMQCRRRRRSATSLRWCALPLRAPLHATAAAPACARMACAPLPCTHAAHANPHATPMRSRRASTSGPTTSWRCQRRRWLRRSPACSTPTTPSRPRTSRGAARLPASARTQQGSVAHMRAAVGARAAGGRSAAHVLAPAPAGST